jgi:hypothetical protein
MEDHKTLELVRAVEASLDQVRGDLTLLRAAVLNLEAHVGEIKTLSPQLVRIRPVPALDADGRRLKRPRGRPPGSRNRVASHIRISEDQARRLVGAAAE